MISKAISVLPVLKASTTSVLALMDFSKMWAEHASKYALFSARRQIVFLGTGLSEILHTRLANGEVITLLTQEVVMHGYRLLCALQTRFSAKTSSLTVLIRQHPTICNSATSERQRRCYDSKIVSQSRLSQVKRLGGAVIYFGYLSLEMR